MAVAAGLVVGLQFLFKGAGFLDGLGVSFDQVVLMYLVGALFGGIALGILRPYLRTRPGGAVVGFWLAFALYMPIGYVMDQSENVSLLTTVLSAATLAVLFGIPAGLYFSKHGFGGG